MFECLFKWVLTDLLPEMSFVCDNYWSRDYHEDTGIRVLHSETRVVSVGIRAYLTVARAIGLDDRSRTLWTILPAYYTSLNYPLLPLTHFPSILDSLSYLQWWSFLQSLSGSEGSELGRLLRDPELYEAETTTLKQLQNDWIEKVC